MVSLPLEIFTDNLSATFVANNPVCHTNLRHVTMDSHFVRERTEEGSLIVKHIFGTLQQDDILTKALRQKAFEDLRVKLLGTFPTSLKGNVKTIIST